MTSGHTFSYTFNDQLDELLRQIEFNENNSFLKSSNGTYIMIKKIESFQVVNADGDVAL